MFTDGASFQLKSQRKVAGVPLFAARQAICAASQERFFWKETCIGVVQMGCIGSAGDCKM